VTYRGKVQTAQSNNTISIYRKMENHLSSNIVHVLSTPRSFRLNQQAQ
jgi:hypothetical protein